MIHRIMLQYFLSERYKYTKVINNNWSYLQVHEHWLTYNVSTNIVNSIVGLMFVILVFSKDVKYSSSGTRSMVIRTQFCNWICFLRIAIHLFFLTLQMYLLLFAAAVQGQKTKGKKTSPPLNKQKKN